MKAMFSDEEIGKDYSHLLPERLRQDHSITARTETVIEENGLPKKMSSVTVYRRRPFGGKVPVLEIEGDHIGSSIEPHIMPLEDRRAAGAAPHALMALLHHVKTKHNLTHVQIPDHTPAAANLIRKLLPLVGKVYQSQQIPNRYRGEEGWADFVTAPNHLMSGFKLTLSEEDPE